MLPKGATKTQAKKLLREIEEQVDKRTFLPTKNVPLFSEVAEKWLEYKKPNLPNHLDLVFPNKAGNPINHNNLVKRHFEPALKAAEIPKVCFHDLRHTYASLMIEQGENIKYIQNQLGHSTPTVTMNVYAHLMKPVNQEAACRLEKAVFETNGDQMETKTKKEVAVSPVTP